MAKCRVCSGTGMDVLTKEGVCVDCKGTGKVVEKEEDKCRACNGIRYSIFDGDYCMKCHGTGKSHK